MTCLEGIRMTRLWNIQLPVLTGKKLAGEKIKRAAERHINNDLRRIDNDNDFIYVYDVDEARKINEFATLLKDVTSGEPFNPSPYQRFILAMIQGWRNPETQGMRLKNIFISMARTNGKTQLLSAYTLYNFLFGYQKSIVNLLYQVLIFRTLSRFIST